ncbi:hypothetical protein GGX14DRAFT_474901 [Mycena pura]|uniref:HNH nuclease domain-containing protein n=1 Tax=Mycena pura TaxID=153505 RepID=A0AAD6UVB8_9AGAR|nr:hypothetical protein GGX14DRAFT_474901 [Mycena pura]
MSLLHARPLWALNDITQINTCGSIYIFHPMDPDFPFLIFDAFSSTPNGDMLGGVPLGAILDTCYVAAGNKSGKLYDSEKADVDDSDPDALLVPGKYQFVIVQDGGELDQNYDLCTTFAVWTPPKYIPRRWQGGDGNYVMPYTTKTEVSVAVRTEDKRCISTGATTALQASHMMPESEEEWVEDHFMILIGYGGNPKEELNSMRNEVAFRADLNGQGLDQAVFFFVPYARSVTALFVDNKAPDLASRYHFIHTAFPTRIRRGYLFVRFAWNVFKHWGSMLDAVQKRKDQRKRDKDKRKHDESDDGTDGGTTRGTSGGGLGGSGPGDGGPGGSSRDDKRPRPDDSDKRGGKKRKRGSRQQDIVEDDSLPTEDASALETDDEEQLAVYEFLDAVVSSEYHLSCLTDS